MREAGRKMGGGEGEREMRGERNGKEGETRSRREIRRE